MHINVLTELCPVNEPFKTPDKYDGSTRLFVIDTNFSQGKPANKADKNGVGYRRRDKKIAVSKLGSVVLLVTKGTANSSVHYLSSQGQLHQIADSLTAYLRLMLLYMGLPDWPLVHLKMELSYWNKVWKFYLDQTFIISRISPIINPHCHFNFTVLNILSATVRLFRALSVSIQLFEIRGCRQSDGSPSQRPW